MSVGCPPLLNHLSHRSKDSSTVVGWLAGSFEFLVPMRLLTSVNLPENPSSMELSPRISHGGLVMGLMTYTGPFPSFHCLVSFLSIC